MADPNKVTDEWARDLATEAKELAVRVSVSQEKHEEACSERHEDLRKWQEESVRTRHDLRNDMLGGFAELRLTIAAQNSAFNNRMMTVTGALILLLLGVIGTQLMRHGI